MKNCFVVDLRSFQTMKDINSPIFQISKKKIGGMVVYIEVQYQFSDRFRELRVHNEQQEIKKKW